MKLFGKETRDGNHPISLEEVTVVVDTHELQELLRFLSFCEKEMVPIEHVHLRDFLKAKGSGADIVIFASSKLPPESP